MYFTQCLSWLINDYNDIIKKMTHHYLITSDTTEKYGNMQRSRGPGPLSDCEAPVICTRTPFWTARFR
jgi:hypothetical protein